MITKIEVDGFKSLKNFQLEFHHGLNVLVGPNGSGKTNIVSFFEFIAHLMESDASEATSCVGGAGAVFRRVEQSYERKIAARIYGCVPLNISANRVTKLGDQQEKCSFCVYDYQFVLIFPESGDSVLFESQRFKIRRTKEFTQHSVCPDSEQWGLDIESTWQNDGTARVKTNAFQDSLLQLPYYPRRNSKGKSNGDEEITPDQIISHMLAGGNMSLVPVISRYTPELWTVSADLTGGQIYNVVPSKLKLPEDSAKPPGIARDGSGLASTLYALQRARNPVEFGPWLYPRRRRDNDYDHRALDKLKAYLNLVNDSVQDITVENDPFDNQLRVKFTIKSGDYQATLPMGLMSDGTLKWLAVVAAAVTANSVFCFEEPENYLHPQMQGQIVTILREILFEKEGNRFTLMTTHSETLLNHCRPSELIIVSMKDGRTEARRCSNASEISDEISRTGFGLGYYFVSNAVQND
jgi:predicted ATPase